MKRGLMNTMQRKGKIISGILLLVTLVAAVFLISCKGIMPYCTVTYMDGDKVLGTEEALSGGRLTFPEIETEEGYEARWLCPDGTVFDPSDTVKESVTLTLSREPIAYTLVLQLGGGTVAEGNPTKWTVADETLELIPPTRYGAEFIGWKDKDGNKIEDFDSSLLACVDNEKKELVLTADWKLTTFGITYDPNGGALPETNPDTYNLYDKEAVLNPAVLRGYTFLGWFDESGEKLTTFEGREGDIVLTAMWEITKFNIVYDIGEGAVNTVNPQYFTFLETVTVGAPTRYGYDFGGWLVGESTVPVNEYVIPVDTAEDVYLTAVWEPHDAVVTVVNGSMAPVRKNTRFGEIFTADMLAESIPGYTLKAYRDQMGNQSVALPYTVDDYDVTLYVSYEPTEYTVKLKHDNGQTEIYRVFTVKTPTFELPTPVREGYTFLGWSDGVTVYTFISEGTVGDKVLTPLWERTSYPVVFNTMGGSSVSNVLIEYGAIIVFDVTTQRNGMVFGGWYEDAEYTKPFVGGTMPARTVTLYARWFYDADFTVTYSANASSVSVNGSCVSGSKVADGTVITLEAPLYVDGKLFSEWVVNGVSYGSSAEISVLLDGNNVSAVANYKSVRGFKYDISSSGGLAISTFASSAFVDGYDIRSTDQSFNGGVLTVNAKFLKSLGTGLKVFALTENGSVSFIYVDITDSSPRPTVKVDFDSAFPNVILSCDIPSGQSFYYSVNGGVPKPFSGSVVLSGVDRSRSNTFTVSPAGGGESYSKTVSAIDQKYSIYYNSSFNYGGRTYDLVVNSEEELNALIEYICFVLAVTDGSYSSEKGRNTVSLEYIIGEDYADEFNADKALAYSKIFDKLSIPYAPSYSTSSFGNGSPKGKVTLYFDDFNTKTTSQSKTEIPDNAGLLTESDRGEGFGNFFIDSLETTQLIRSLYELESLPFGVRPVFDSTADSQRAKQVYDAAREVLARYVSDGMTDYEKAAVFYDYLGLTVTYDKVLAGINNGTGDYRGFTSYGALIDRVAVCDGYASAYRIMCLIEGIPCVEIIGTSDGIGHAWNKVLIEGVWYGVDATWSRVVLNYPTHRYLLVTHRYLLVNEAQLIESGHVENYTVDENGDPVKNYITFVASGENDHYDMTGAVITKASELKGIINSAAAKGITVIELKNLSGKSIAKLFEGYRLNDFDAKNVSYTTINGTDIVYIILSLK